MGKQPLRMSRSEVVRGAEERNAGLGDLPSPSSQTTSTTNAHSIGSTIIGYTPLAPPHPDPTPDSQTPQPQPQSQPQPATDTTTQTPRPSASGSLPQKRKPPINKSPLWQYFTRIKLPNSEEIDPGLCICNICKAKINCSVKKKGTSSMKYHVNFKCTAHPLFSKEKSDPKQPRLALDNVSGSVKSHKYNKARCDDKCISMIIVDELPFRFVEKKGFRELCYELNPEWPILSRKQIARRVLDKFNYEKILLLTGLKAANTRVSITTDTWTSLQNINYTVLTAHFLDNDWQLHKRIINFCPITSHKGDDIGACVDSCLRQWQLTKIFTVTVDNASSNDVAIQYVKRRLRNYNTLLFDGEFLHLRCACHIINLVVKDGLKELESGIAAITHCVKYIRSSAARLDKFRVYAVEEQCRPNANIPLDVATRWNSTFLMLEAALKYEHVFGRMGFEDAAFKAYFDDRVGPPQSEDWRNAHAFCIFLKKFYDATEHLSAWKTCTINLLFVELITLQTEINRAIGSDDSCLRRVGQCMKEKFDKYWGRIEDMNQIIMVANVLDPMYKLEWGHVALMRVNAKPEVIDSYESVLKAALLRMYQVYKSESVSNAMEEDACFDLENEEFAGLDEISREILRNRLASQSVIIRNEVDQYLNDNFQLSTLNYKTFDIAKWWKLNESVYPVLSRLAKDIFAIPCSTVASENAFSLGSRVVDPFRASLTPTMVEALVCTADWLRADPVNLYKEPTEDELAFYKELEDMEKEIAGLKNAAVSGASGISGAGGSLESGGEQQQEQN